MPRLDGSLTKREEAAQTWRRQHELDDDLVPTISRQDPHFVPRASAMLRGNFSLATFGTPETVVWWAAHENEMEIIQQLSRDPSVDVNWRNAHGATPFYIAVRNGHLDSVRLMTNIRRVDYDAVCAKALDASPFWIACRQGHAEMVELLLKECPCDTQRPNRYGLTPLDAARNGGHHDVVKMLEAHGADRGRISRERLPSIKAAAPPTAIEADPGEGRGDADDDASTIGAWVCHVCKRHNDDSLFRERKCRICHTPPPACDDGFHI
jgi:hypothetical protein